MAIVIGKGDPTQAPRKECLFPPSAVIGMGIHRRHLMTKLESWPDEEESLYTLPPVDPLGVLTSTQPVVEQGEIVWINPDQVEALCQRWLHEDAQPSAYNKPQWDTHYHFSDGTERSINWLLVLD